MGVSRRHSGGGSSSTLREVNPIHIVVDSEEGLRQQRTCSGCESCVRKLRFGGGESTMLFPMSLSEHSGRRACAVVDHQDGDVYGDIVNANIDSFSPLQCNERSDCGRARNSSVVDVDEQEIVKSVEKMRVVMKAVNGHIDQEDKSTESSSTLMLTDCCRRRRRSGRRSTSSSSFSTSLLFGLIFIVTSVIHSSHQTPQSFFSPSSDEWDGGSFRSGTYGNGYTCVNIPVNFTLCKNIGYTKMMIPNLLGHDSLQEAEFHAKSWVPLLGLQCHPDTQLFLCSLFSPICLDRPIYPCRSLCQGVQAKCEPRMLAYNYPWPSMLKCDQFPEDHDLCIPPGAANKSHGVDPELECPSCNQAHTCENIVDNFCRADFVFRAKYKRSKGTLVEFRKERWFKPREGTRRGRLFRTLRLDSKDDCCATQLVPNYPYIVMGVKKGDEYVVTFAMEWNGKDKILKNAVRTFRSMDCTNPLPMSVTAAGGKLGAERNATTSTGAGRRRRRKQGRRRERKFGGCRVSAPGKN
ncbi:unnamed protein product [Orchesella dallaii]|uniref:Secreted frizzled-related protein 5 n=1 Tax=Orchesella dallaii TaxID=48710 RepID=A0ABP1QPA1_9HEXA